MPRRADPTTPDLERRRAAYDTLRTLLIALLVLIVLASLVVLLWQAQEIRRQGAEAARQRTALTAQTAQIHNVLLGLQANETNRAKAVRQIVEAQRLALARHDRATQDYLRRNLRLISTEVYSPANREQRATSTRTTVVYLAPKPAGFIGPVAPRPPTPPASPRCAHPLPHGRCRQ